MRPAWPSGGARPKLPRRMRPAGLREQPFTRLVKIAEEGNRLIVVVDEAQIPGDYWEPREPRLNKQALLSDLKVQGEIAGVSLSQPEPTLSVRTR